MAREIVIMTPEQVEVKYELAGIGSRAIAMLVDTFWQALVGAVFVAIMIGVGIDAPDHWLTSVWLIALLFIMLFGILGGYFLYFEATKNGQTPGKKAAGIRVVLDTGHPVDFRAALLRNLMRIIDMMPLSYGVAIISVFFSKDYRRLGDYVGGTLVVKTGSKAETLDNRYSANGHSDSVDSWVQESSSMLPVECLPYISSIHKDEYRAIRHFLDRKAELESQIAANLAAKLSGPIAAKLKIQPDAVGDPTVFLEAVGKEWERRAIH